MNCKSLKEAIDITFEKYKYEKSESNYKKILNFLLQGQYHYITSDNGARKYVVQSNLLYEIENLYEEAMKGNEGLLDASNVSLGAKISSIANYFANYSKLKNKIGFGTLANIIDKLNVDNKTELLYNLMSDDENELGLTSGDVKRLVVENAYRLFRLHSCRSGNIILDLYSDDNCPVAERVNLSNQINSYLFQLFEEIKPEQLPDFINGLEQEQIYYMCNLYDVTRRNFKNSNYINVADTMNVTRETISIFDAFSDVQLPKKISETGISY